MIFIDLLITVFISLVENYRKLVLETVVISSRIYGLLTGPEQLLSYLYQHVAVHLLEPVIPSSYLVPARYLAALTPRKYGI